MESYDITDMQNAMGLAITLRKYAQEYHDSRVSSANAKHSLDILLASAMPTLSAGKRVLGAETGLLLFLSRNDDEVNEIYKAYLVGKARADGLEKIISAIETQISLFQSIAKALPK